MVLTFANGGTPAGNDPYTGVVVTDGTSVLTQIESTLQTAGWLTQSGTPAGGAILMEGDLGGDKCYIKFSITGLQSQILLIQGSDDSIESNLSPSGNDGTQMIFDQSGSNRIFITADTHAGVLALFPRSGLAQLFHFGFLDRIDAADDTCIMVGRICSALAQTTYESTTSNGVSWSGYGSAYIHTSAHDAGTWERLWAQFDSGLSTDTRDDAGIQTPIYSNYDPVVIPISGSSHDQLTSTSSNTSYRAFEGGINPVNQKPLLAPYFYLEGYNPAQYGNSQGGNSLPFYYRGDVEFAFRGMSGLPAGTQINGDSGNVYITGELGWQAIRIA